MPPRSQRWRCRLHPPAAHGLRRQGALMGRRRAQEGSACSLVSPDSPDPWLPLHVGSAPPHPRSPCPTLHLPLRPAGVLLPRQRGLQRRAGGRGRQPAHCPARRALPLLPRAPARSPRPPPSSASPGPSSGPGVPLLAALGHAGRGHQPGRLGCVALQLPAGRKAGARGLYDTASGLVVSAQGRDCCDVRACAPSADGVLGASPRGRRDAQVSSH